jgi:hypothetical protein
MKKDIDKFSNFMNGITAAVQLLNRASKNGYFIEYICLAASVIDGLLRMGLILQHQLDTKSTDILDSLMYQSDEDKIVSERNIYKKALKKNIISRELFDELNDLYNKRNGVIHCYIISHITTKEVLDIGIEYGKIQQIVKSAVRKIEDEQIKKGIGMTVSGEGASKEEMEKIMDEMISEKHGDDILNKTLKRGKNL